jgi:acyl-coenzyme A thioesterase PaaI-like protein
MDSATRPGSEMWELSPEELRERFYDFPNIPMHKYLAMTFEREHPDGPAIVTLPSSPEYTAADGTQSEAAVFTIGEVAAGVAVSDAIVPIAMESDKRPVVLTKSASFSPKAPARGAMTAECAVVGDYEAAFERMRKRFKADVDIGVKIYDEQGTLVGESVLHFYVRLMDESRLKAMAAMSPGMAG